MRFGDLALPLRELGVRGDATDLAQILASRTWDRLESLVLDCELRDAFAAARFPALRALTVNTDRVLEACRAITRAPDAAHLEALTLGAALPTEAVTLLCEQRARFSRLAALRVTARGNELARLLEAGYPF